MLGQNIYIFVGKLFYHNVFFVENIQIQRLHVFNGWTVVYAFCSLQTCRLLHTFYELSLPVLGIPSVSIVVGFAHSAARWCRSLATARHDHAACSQCSHASPPAFREFAVVRLRPAAFHCAARHIFAKSRRISCFDFRFISLLALGLAVFDQISVEIGFGIEYSWNFWKPLTLIILLVFHVMQTAVGHLLQPKSDRIE